MLKSQTERSMAQETLHHRQYNEISSQMDIEDLEPNLQNTKPIDHYQSHLNFCILENKFKGLFIILNKVFEITISSQYKTFINN